MLLKPGEQTTLGHYTLRNDGVKVSDDGQKQMVTAYITVFEDGKQIDTMYPAQVVLPQARAGADDRGRDPPDASREDLYIVLAFEPSDLATQTASLQIVVNPLVNWIWFGFGVMALRHRHRAAAGAHLLLRAGEAAGGGGATDATALVLLLAPARRHRAVRAAAAMQRRVADDSADVVLRAHAAREAAAARDRLHLRAAATPASRECRKDPCATSHEMRGELAALIDQGKSHDEIIQAFIAKYGSEEMLGAPIDKGFNRLAWLFPYLVGATGAVAIGFAAVKWTRRSRDRARRARAARSRDRRAPRR